ncbi:GNAT family N-acetyltransferase [Kitasatospora sp. NPDC006697]|uniref:GNAT family N-acetyltransferase n=1 Tax=Kitasatospora sp. NPDC006697 TaxID=3364020 RepID=UPI0036C2DBEE
MNDTQDGAATAAPSTAPRPPELLDLPGGFVLRRRTTADADPVNQAIVRNIDHLRPWMAWAASSPTPAHTAEMTRVGWQLWEAGTDFMYVLERAGRPDSVLGMFGLHRRIGPGALEIGYWVDREHTGRSLATNGAAALTRAALALSDIERVEIHCDQANAASAAVPRKLGYRLDRIDRQPIDTPAATGKKLIWITEQAGC